MQDLAEYKALPDNEEAHRAAFTKLIERLKVCILTNNLRRNKRKTGTVTTIDGIETIRGGIDPLMDHHMLVHRINGMTKSTQSISMMMKGGVVTKEGKKMKVNGDGLDLPTNIVESTRVRMANHRKRYENN